MVMVHLSIASRLKRALKRTLEPTQNALVPTDDPQNNGEEQQTNLPYEELRKMLIEIEQAKAMAYKYRIYNTA